MSPLLVVGYNVFVLIPVTCLFNFLTSIFWIKRILTLIQSIVSIHCNGYTCLIVYFKPLTEDISYVA